MRSPKIYKYVIQILIGFILGFLIGRYTPTFKGIHYYTLSGEEREIVNQLDFYENYDLFQDLESIRYIIRNLFISDVQAETLSEEEQEIVKDMDLYEDYTMWEDMSEDNEFFVEDIHNISEEEWEMLDTVAYIDDELLDYYEIIEEGEEDEEE